MEILLVLILILNYKIYKAEDPDCRFNPCKNGGKCMNENGRNNFKCQCQDGYSGPTCGNENTTKSTLSTSEASASTSTLSTTDASASTSTLSTTKASASTTTASTTKTFASTTTASTTKNLSSTTTVSATEASASASTVSATEASASTTTASTTKTLASTTSKLTKLSHIELTSRTSTYSSKSDNSPSLSPTAVANRLSQGYKTTVVVSVTIPVVVVVICAVILGVCLIRRWKRKKGLGTTALERAPGISISNTSYGDHELNISKTSANGHATDVASNEYAEIVANENPVNEQQDGYYTINDVPKISQTYNKSYAHVNTHKALMFDSNYSHIENNNKKVSKRGDYGFSKFKRGIFQLKKSSKKDADSSYDNLEMKTVAHNPNKNVKDVAMTELESEYNHTQSGVPESTKKDIQNEKDEYQHLNYKPKSMNAQAHEVANENPYLGGQSQLTSELLENLRANEQESENGVRHDYFVLEVIGESGDDSIKESDMSKFEEGNSNRASGFQYECAREIERSGTHKNEEASDIQSACHYELSKDIDTNIDIASTPADVDDRLGTYSATDDENQNHHYFILSKT